MKQVFTIIITLLGFISFAQTTSSKCIIKAKDGAPFFLYVNGN